MWRKPECTHSCYTRCKLCWDGWWKYEQHLLVLQQQEQVRRWLEMRRESNEAVAALEAARAERWRREGVTPTPRMIEIHLQHMRDHEETRRDIEREMAEHEELVRATPRTPF